MPASSQRQDNSQVKILIIEDDPSVRKVIGEYLSTKGFQTLEAEDGKAGLNLFSKESPDLILLDLRLPVMDGLEVLARISKDAPHIPVIIVSGKGTVKDDRHGSASALETSGKGHGLAG